MMDRESTRPVALRSLVSSATPESMAWRGEVKTLLGVFQEQSAARRRAVSAENPNNNSLAPEPCRPPKPSTSPARTDKETLAAAGRAEKSRMERR
jgi:hypothetical protein